MMRFSIALILGICLSTLVGCVNPPKYSEAVSTFPQLAAGQGRIYFYRDPMPLGVEVQPEIKLNGAKVGNSIPAKFFYVDRPAGNYIVSCATEAEHKLSLSLDGGETKYVRTEINMGLFIGQVKPLLEDRTQAEKTLKDCSYVVSK